MLKDKMNYKLINCVLILVIIFLIYKAGNLWLGILNIIWKIALPFLIAFVIAYALHPLVKKLTDHKVPKGLAIALILLLLFGIFTIFGLIVVPLLFNQLGSLFSNTVEFINE